MSKEFRIVGVAIVALIGLAGQAFAAPLSF